MKPTVILTRAAADSSRLAHRLTAHHFRAWQQPLLEIRPLSQTQGVDLPSLTADDIVIYTSANAVTHGVEPIRLASAGRPFSMAVGRRTAATLTSHGIHAMAPEREDSEGLLGLPRLQVLNGHRVVLVKGQGGRELLADTLRARGAEVIEFPCYRRVYVNLTRQVIAQQLAPLKPLVWVVGSGEMMEHLGRQLAQHGFPELQAQALVVPSVRVALLASTAGWRHVLTAADASDSAVIELLDRTYL